MKKSKKASKAKKSNKYNLLVYVENCDPRIKRFDSGEEMLTFINKFNNKYPDSKASETGYWIEYLVTGVTGEVISNDNLNFEVT